MDTKISPEVQKLIDIYRKAQEQLIKTITDMEAKGTVTSYQKSMLRQVTQILQELDEEAKTWTDEAVPSSYQHGIDDVNSKLEDMGINLSTKGGALNEDAINLLAGNAYLNLHDANNYVGRRINDAVRQAGIDAVSQKIAQGQTVPQCKQNLMDSLVSDGIDAIKDKRGRNISLTAYTEVVARSTTREATNTAALNQLKNNGYDLVKMSSHSPTCSLCAIYQGRVYSISGKNTDYPALDTAYSGEYANIHPNCAHVLEFYSPEYADDPEGDKEFSNRPFELTEKDKKMLEKYNKQQTEKAQIRRDRKQYEKYKTVLGEEVPKSFANFRHLKYNNIDRWAVLKESYSDKLAVDLLGKKGIEVAEKIDKKQFVINNYKPEISEMTVHARDNLENKSDRAGMTTETAQSFIDNAKLVVYDSERKTVKFMAEDGYSVLNLNNRLVTAVPQKWRKKYDKYVKRK